MGYEVLNLSPGKEKEYRDIYVVDPINKFFKFRYMTIYDDTPIYYLIRIVHFVNPFQFFDSFDSLLLDQFDQLNVIHFLYSLRIYLNG